MTRLPTPKQVLAHLRNGWTVAEVERITGWPAHGIRGLVRRQPGLLISPDGHVYTPIKVPAGPAYLAEVTILEPRPADVLYAELLAQKKELDLPWRDVLHQLQISGSVLDELRRGKASTRTRERIEGWLVHTSRQREDAA